MKVALCAPDLHSENGGIRNFVLWIMNYVSPHVETRLIAKHDLIIEAGQLLGHPIECTSFEKLDERTRRTWRFRLLEAENRGSIAGIELPYYRRGSERLRRRLFANRLVSLTIGDEVLRSGADLVHVPLQSFTLKEAGGLPFVLNPHDYQHEHLPQFFSEDVLQLRKEVWYPIQRQAAAIVTHSLQTRDDAIRFARIPEERVFYAPYGAIRGFPDPGDAASHEIAARIGLPDNFLFYPARMWGHKNHIGLLEAVALLKRRGIDVDCVFTRGGDCEADVIAAVDRLGLTDRVTITGTLGPEEMGAAYRTAGMVVVPSLFEQNSGPMLEALHFGKAIAVSNIREMAASLNDAGLLFDPRSTQEMAEAIERVMGSADTRQDLERRAAERRDAMSWQPFVDCYRDAYEYAAGKA